MNTIATYTAYATSAFIFIPAGRDIISYKTPLLPGEAATRKLMTATKPAARNFMWGVWGLNHCALSYLKCLAIYKNDKSLLQFLTVTAAITFGYLLKEKNQFDKAGGDINGFLVLCGVQTAALTYLSLA